MTQRDAEAARLERLFGLRRDRLLDLSARNPLVNYKHRPTSKRQLRFVDAVLDAVLDAVFGQLADEGAALSILALPEPDEVSLDERTDEFIDRLEHASPPTEPISRGSRSWRVRGPMATSSWRRPSGSFGIAFAHS